MSLLGGILWNLLLATIPVVLGNCIGQIDQQLALRRNVMLRLGQILLFLIWLALLPNTCYLLTEWRHFLDIVDSQNLYLRAERSQRVLYDICVFAVFYLFYSGFGAMSLALSIRPVEQLLSRRRVKFFFIAPFLFTLLSLGVYLGLLLRFNSWDLLARPSRVWSSIMDIPHSPLLITSIVVFALFLWGMYEAIDIWVDGVRQRLRPAKRSN
ncbi:MAG TPA: DUF1361 domain-containing protein [Abditibacteriaceae bacterium]|nr:DUF1361 domain-containing protein [Abditibacteriaceae bacterium]